MPNLISFIEKKVESKGLNINNQINQKKLQEYFFDDDFQNLQLLEGLTLNLDNPNPTLFYPGSGADILFPLHYLEKLFPSLKQTKFIFIDKTDNLGLIKTVLDDVGIHFTEKDNSVQFYFNDLLVNLEFITTDVFSLDLPLFDIYFEKAFRIIKDRDPYYEYKVIKKLTPGGILISDSGFQNFALKKLNISSDLSGYQEMILGIKSI